MPARVAPNTFGGDMGGGDVDGGDTSGDAAPDTTTLLQGTQCMHALSVHLEASKTFQRAAVSKSLQDVLMYGLHVATVACGELCAACCDLLRSC